MLLPMLRQLSVGSGECVLLLYNVMWIGWDGDIVYREAVGKVRADVSERQQLKEIDITLG